MKIYLPFWSGLFVKMYRKKWDWTTERKHSFLWVDRMENMIQLSAFTLIYTHFFTIKILPPTLYSPLKQCRYPLRKQKHEYIKSQDRKIMYVWVNLVETWRSLLLLAFGFPVHHLSEARQDLALSLPPLLLVEGRQSSLFIRTVDLVFLSQTHGLHTTMSAGLHLKFISALVQYLGHNI